MENKTTKTKIDEKNMAIHRKGVQQLLQAVKSKAKPAKPSKAIPAKPDGRYERYKVSRGILPMLKRSLKRVCLPILVQINLVLQRMKCPQKKT
jgi:hypothetical protein